MSALTYPAVVPVSEELRGLSVGAIREKARRDAQAVLDAWWTPDLLPVDPVSIARALGASVFKADLENDVFGMLVWGEDGADIYLDKDQPHARFRFSCAHEIGHYIVRSRDIAPGTAVVDKRSDDERGAPDEVHANEFAGSLLMPAAALRSAVMDEGADDFTLMRRFDVSLDALRYRRQLLGF